MNKVKIYLCSQYKSDLFLDFKNMDLFIPCSKTVTYRRYRTWRLFGPGVNLGPEVYLLNACFSIWRFMDPRSKFPQKRLKNMKQCHQLCLI